MIAINPDVEVTTYHTFLASDNAEEIIKPWDFVIDCTDNFPVKFLINDACVRLGKAFSHGGILRFQGQTFTHLPGTACYRCFFKEPPPAGAVPTSSQAGVLGAIAGMLGTIQAAEALKYFLGVGELLTDRLLTFDAKTMNFRTIKVKKRASCEICGDHPTIDHLIDYEQAACDLRQKKASGKHAQLDKNNLGSNASFRIPLLPKIYLQIFNPFSPTFRKSRPQVQATCNDTYTT